MTAPEMSAEAPDWVRTALLQTGTDTWCEHAGARLHYRHWGRANHPALVLIHGAMAHSHWWDWVAPRLAARFRVLAVDLAGMGDSGHRNAYSLPGFADDVRAVMAHAGVGPDTVVIGHSLGGMVALAFGARHADAARGIVMVDSAIYPPDLPSPFDPSKAPYRPKTLCPDRVTATARFALLPPQPCPHPALVDYVAAHSVAAMDGGWTWKFDDQVFRHMAAHEPWRDLDALRVPLAVIHGEASAVMTPPVLAHLRAHAQRTGGPMIGIPDAHHHLMLDAPRALCAAIEGLLGGWPGGA